MAHPSVDEIVAGSAQAHLRGCGACRRLATLLGASVPDAATTGDLDVLPVVDDLIYSDWSALAEARGGMGTISRARDRRLGRFVAIKQLRPGVGGGERPALVRRFEREARLTGRLQHPAIIGVHEAGRFGDGEPFYAMPLLRGVPLGQEITKRTTTAARLGLLPHLTTVAEAVAYAHDQGIVHRDIKPDNILIGEFGETVLIDWGLAKDLRQTTPESEGVYRELPSDGAFTQLGVGTPQYMPPEQARGQAPDVRFDVYALGATLYHALAGEPPFGSEGATAARRALADGSPEPLARLAPDVPRELVDIVERAMARDPAARFASAQALADELRRYQTGQLLRSRRYTVGELLGHFARRYRTAIRISAIAVVVLVATAVIAFVRIARERDRASSSQQRAERELRRAQGIIASQEAANPGHRLDAVVRGVNAIGPELRAGRPPVPEGLQGLVDAVTVGPPLVPLGHTGLVKGIARAGDRLLGVDDARALVVWDARSGKLLATHPTVVPSPELVASSPDRKRAIVCGNDPIAEIIDIATGVGHRIDAKANVAGCNFLPDGRAITAADELVVRNPLTAAVEQSFPLPAGASSLAVSPTGRVAVCTLDGTLVLWGAGASPRQIRGNGLVGHLRFSVDGATVFQNGAQTVNAIDFATGAVTGVYTARDTHLGRSAPSPDDRYLAIGTFDMDQRRHAIVIDRTGARPPREVDGLAETWTDARRLFVDHLGPLTLVDVSGGRVLELAAHDDEASTYPDANRLATASRDGPAFLWDLTPGLASGMLLGHTAEIVTVATHGDALLTASHDGSARIWSTRDGGERTELAGESEITAAAWLGDRVVVGDLAGDVRIYADGTLRGAAHVGGPISALATAGSRVAIGSLAGTLEIRNADLGAPVVLASTSAVTALAFSPDGARVVSGHVDGSTHAWDATSGAELAHATDQEPLEGPDDHEGHAALLVSRDGARVLAARPPGHTLVFDAATLAPRGRLDGRALALSPDGHRVASTLVDGTVVLQGLDGASPIRLVGHRAAVLAAAFSADGVRLATASIDGSLRVWSADRGELVVTIAAPSLGAATAVAFVGDWLVAGYASGAVRLHPTTAATAARRACDLLDRFGRTTDVAPYCD